MIDLANKKGFGISPHYYGRIGIMFCSGMIKSRSDAAFFMCFAETRLLLFHDLKRLSQRYVVAIQTVPSLKLFDCAAVSF